MERVRLTFAINPVVASVVAMVAGVILIVFPGVSLKLMGVAVGLLLLVIGVLLMKAVFRMDKANLVLLAFSIVILMGAGYTIYNPLSVASLIPFIAGICLIVYGILDLVNVKMLTGTNQSMLWTAIATDVFMLVCGLICVVNSLGVITTTVRLVGALLVISGLAKFASGLSLRGNREGSGRVIDGSVVSEQDI